MEAKLSTPSSIAMTCPSRPDYGTVGTKCVVRANHFLVKLQERDLHRYDVSITPEIVFRGVNRAVMKDLVSQYRHSHLGGLQTGPLPFQQEEFVIKLVEKDEEQDPSGIEREFKVVIKFAGKSDLQQLRQFLSGRQRDAPRHIIQVLDILLKQKQSNEYTTVGRSFFSLEPGPITDLGEGLECWKGYYQSLRPTQMGMSLNIDAAVGAFYKAIPVIEYICKLLDITDSSKPLTDSDCTKEFDQNPQIPVRSARSDLIESTLVKIHDQSEGQLQLLIIILPDFSSSYGTIKRICETELGIISQCCRLKNVLRCSDLHLESLALKINVKAGGRNTVLLDAHLRNIPMVTDVPTIIFGADVTHPGTGEDSSPSIAAVVASMDWPEVTTYRGLVSAQTRRQELIQDLYKVVQDPQKGAVHGGMIRELLLQFFRSNGGRKRITTDNALMHYAFDNIFVIIGMEQETS